MMICPVLWLKNSGAQGAYEKCPEVDGSEEQSSASSLDSKFLTLFQTPICQVLHLLLPSQAFKCFQEDTSWQLTSPF